MKQTKLKTWMDEKGYSNRELARELGLSYDYIYKIATPGKDKREITNAFKFLFLERFGIEEANKVFEIALPQTAEVA